jgi:hypothetical protein
MEGFAHESIARSAENFCGPFSHRSFQTVPPEVTWLEVGLEACEAADQTR